MPVYEYVCKECGTHFDKLRPMSQADNPIACTQCQSESTRRMLSHCYASSEGRAITAPASSCSCGGCGGGSCGSCGSHSN